MEVFFQLNKISTFNNRAKDFQKYSYKRIPWLSLSMTAFLFKYFPLITGFIIQDPYRNNGELFINTCFSHIKVPVSRIC